MQKLTTAVVLAILLATSSATFAAPDADAIIAKEKASWQAFKDKDEAAFRKLCAPEFREVTSSGIHDLSAVVKNMKDTNLKSFAISDTKCVFPDPETAVLTYKVTIAGTSDGKDISGTAIAGAVWRKMGADWTAVFYSEAEPEDS